MPATPRSLGGCPPPPEEGVEEDDELASKGSVSMAGEGEGRGGANIECAIHMGIPSNGALGLKKGLKIETT